MIDPTSGFNKGYCFVTYCSQSDSAKACERVRSTLFPLVAANHRSSFQLDGYAIRPGKMIKVNGSVANLRLFIGNIPKTKSKEEIKEELHKVVGKCR